MPEGKDIRCSDDDRRFVEEVLNEAFAEGRISGNEREERVAIAWQAKTFGDLRSLTSDLIAVEDAVRIRTTPVPDDGLPRATVDRAGGAGSDRIVAVMSTQRRVEANWRFARQTNVLSVMGEVVLDLTNAVFEDYRCEIEVLLVMGSLKVVVPAGVNVHNESIAVMGGFEVKGLLPEPNGPNLVFKGMVLMSSITVTGPQKPRKRRLFGK